MVGGQMFRNWVEKCLNVETTLFEAATMSIWSILLIVWDQKALVKKGGVEWLCAMVQIKEFHTEAQLGVK